MIRNGQGGLTGWIISAYRLWAGQAVLPTRPILVTGPHRSGTTWVGRMITSHPGIAYLSEPFNVRVPPSPVRYFFQHVTAADEPAFRAYLAPLLAFQDSARYQIGEHGLWPTIRRGGRTMRTWWHRQSQQHPLLKDPIAFFAAEWLAATFRARHSGPGPSSRRLREQLAAARQCLRFQRFRQPARVNPPPPPRSIC